MAIELGKWFTWGRAVVAAVVGVAWFATFVAGQVAGANSLEPRVAELEKRTEAVEVRLSKQGEDLAEIKGYVRAIAGKMGVTP
jgi:hypothetical protein